MYYLFCVLRTDYYKKAKLFDMRHEGDVVGYMGNCNQLELPESEKVVVDKGSKEKTKCDNVVQFLEALCTL